ALGSAGGATPDPRTQSALPKVRPPVVERADAPEPVTLPNPRRVERHGRRQMAVGDALSDQPTLRTIECVRMGRVQPTRRNRRYGAKHRFSLDCRNCTPMCALHPGSPLTPLWRTTLFAGGLSRGDRI